MKTLTIEEMIVNAILNPGTKYTMEHWEEYEYIMWDKTFGVHCFIDEDKNSVDLTHFATDRDGWITFKGEKVKYG